MRYCCTNISLTKELKNDKIRLKVPSWSYFLLVMARNLMNEKMP